jgi:hypothetical protein
LHSKPHILWRQPLKDCTAFVRGIILQWLTRFQPRALNSRKSIASPNQRLQQTGGQRRIAVRWNRPQSVVGPPPLLNLGVRLTIE